MQLSEIKPGQRLWWRRPSRQHRPTFKPAHVLGVTKTRVRILINLPYGPARRAVKPEYLFSKLPGLSR